MILDFTTALAPLGWMTFALVAVSAAGIWFNRDRSPVAVLPPAQPVEQEEYVLPLAA